MLLSLISQYKLLMHRTSLLNNTEMQQHFGFWITRLDETLEKDVKRSLKENMIVSNFNNKFPDLKVDSYESFLLVVNIKREVQQWHIKFNRAFTVVNEISQDLLDAGLELEDWEQYLSEREQIKSIRRDFTTASERAVKTHKLAMSKLVDATEKLVAESSEINTILSLGQEYLEAPVLRKMVAITNSDKRRIALKQAVAIMRAEYFKKWKETGEMPGKGK